ncbi:MAG: hypothetical protein ACOX9B_04080, partial [Candidatus Xenobium sp.]
MVRELGTRASETWGIHRPCYHGCLRIIGLPGGAVNRFLPPPESAAWRENRGHRGGSGCQEGVRSEERSVVGNYVSTAEVRLT